MSRLMSLLATKSPNRLVMPRSERSGGAVETSRPSNDFVNEDLDESVELCLSEGLDLTNQGMVIGKENYSWASEKRI